MNLPPLPPMLPALAALAALHKPATRVKVGGSPADGFVQVMLDTADDAHAKLLIAQAGIEFAPHSLVPLTGILFVTVNPDGKYRYCWRG